MKTKLFNTMNSIRINILTKIAKGHRVLTIQRSLVKINGALVHYRMKSQASNGVCKFPFNINPTTLTAQYEVWICGSESVCFLIPIKIIREIYNDPDTYTNKTPNQEDIKTLTVDTLNNEVVYGRNGKRLSITAFRNKKLDEI